MVLTVVKCKKCHHLQCVGTGFLCAAKNKEMTGLDANNSRACNYYQEREEAQMMVESKPPEGATKKIMEIIEEKRRTVGSPEKGITIESIIALHDEGLNTMEIGKRLGCTSENVSNRLKRAGLVPKKSVGRKKKSGGNGKAKIKKWRKAEPVRLEAEFTEPLSTMEAAFDRLKQSRIERFKQALFSLTLEDALEFSREIGIDEFGETLIGLTQDLKYGKQVA